MNDTMREWGLTVLRLVVGIVFLAHGWQKIFVMGAAGVTGILGSIGIPLPNVAAVVLMAVEFLGGLVVENRPLHSLSFPCRSRARFGFRWSLVWLGAWEGRNEDSTDDSRCVQLAVVWIHDQILSQLHFEPLVLSNCFSVFIRVAAS